MQVEETLNNSNDLFLTFRKEMEEMSKKTKRLEKENQILQRKKDTLDNNITQMVEDRTKMQEDLAIQARENEEQRRKISRLEMLCREMQKQGRGQVPTAELEEDEEATESDYEDEEDYEEEEGSGEYDDDTEEDAIEPVPEARPFGPVPPPPPPPQAIGNSKLNGHRQPNGQINGVKR